MMDVDEMMIPLTSAGFPGTANIFRILYYRGENLISNFMVNTVFEILKQG